MESKLRREELPRRLRLEINRLYTNDGSPWKRPIVRMLHQLKKEGIEAVFFGGTLRSLLASRLYGNGPGRPRDLDIVVAGKSIDVLRDIIGGKIERETRFGGVQVQDRLWQFDLWPVEKTWAFVADDKQERAFAQLPETTFFNLEAIAVDVWTQKGRPRQIFDGNGQFFDGLINRVIEVNREDNPFPTLCVVRALVMAYNLDFAIGPKLRRYIAAHGASITRDEIGDVQRSHYGGERQSSRSLYEWVRFIVNDYDESKTGTTKLPVERRPQPKQLDLWPDQPCHRTVRLHASNLQASQLNTAGQE